MTSERGPDRLQRVGALLTAVGASAYLLVKVAWIAGSTVGVVSLGATSMVQWRWDNLVTGAFGVAGLAVAVVLWSRWGRRLPWWLVAPPLWLGAGLVLPFVVLLPVSIVLALAGHPVSTSAPNPADPQLAGWVFAVVYGGFATVAVGLVVAVPAYARTRWAHLVMGRLGDRPAETTRPVTWGALTLSGVVASIHLGWALGVPLGRTGRPDVLARVEDLFFAGLALITALAVLLLAARRPPSVRTVWPTLGVWLGTGWMLSGVLSVPQLLTGQRWAPAGFTYGAHATITALTLTAGLLAVVGLVLHWRGAGVARR